MSHVCMRHVTHASAMSYIRTGWRRPIGCLKLQVIFRRRANNYRAVLREMTYTGKASNGSLPPCMYMIRMFGAFITRKKRPSASLQRNVTHCNTLRLNATYCNTLRHTATHCNALQPTATHCNAHTSITRKQRQSIPNS